MFPGGEGGQCVGLTALPPSCADCRKIWEPQPPGTFKACNEIALPKVIIRGPDNGARARVYVCSVISDNSFKFEKLWKLVIRII
jgi:hypothetical protein